MLWTIYLDNWYVGTYTGDCQKQAYENMVNEEFETRSYDDYEILEVTDDTPDHEEPVPSRYYADQAEDRWYAWRTRG